MLVDLDDLGDSGKFLRGHMEGRPDEDEESFVEPAVEEIGTVDKHDNNQLELDAVELYDGHPQRGNYELLHPLAGLDQHCLNHSPVTPRLLALEVVAVEHPRLAPQPLLLLLLRQGPLLYLDEVLGYFHPLQQYLPLLPAEALLPLPLQRLGGHLWEHFFSLELLHQFQVVGRGLEGASFYPAEGNFSELAGRSVLKGRAVFIFKARTLLKK